MSTGTKNLKNTRKVIAFILIVALLIGGMSSFAIPGLAGTEGFKVTFTVDNAKDEYTVTSEDKEAVALPKEIIPDDPKAGDNELFLGWRNLSGDTKKEKETLWSAKDLKDFVLDEDTEFEAVFEDIDAEDPVDEKQTEQQTDDSRDSTEEDTDKKKNDEIQTKASESHIQMTIDDKVVTNGNLETITDWNVNKTKTLKVKVTGINGTSGFTDNYIVINLPEGLTYTTYNGKNGTWQNGLDKLVDMNKEPTAHSVDGYSAVYGELIYKVKAGSTEVEAEIQITPDKTRHYGPHTMKNNITAELKGNKDGIANIEKAEFKASITSDYSTRILYLPQEAKYALPNEDVQTQRVFTYSVIDNEINYILVKDFQIQITYATQAALKSLNFDGLNKPNANLTQTYTDSYGNTFEGVKVDENERTITLYYQNSIMSQTNTAFPILEFDATKVSEGKNYKYQNVKITATSYDGTKLDGVNNPVVCEGNNVSPGVTIAKDNDTLVLTMQKFAPGVASHNEALNIVARTILVNNSGKVLNNQVLKYEFPKEYNVRGFDVPVPNGNTREITVTYQAFGGLTKAVKTTVKGNNNERAAITPDILGLGSTEVLQNAEINCGSFPENYTMKTNVMNGSCVYGNVYSADAGGSHTIKVGIGNGSVDEASMHSYTSTPNDAMLRVRVASYIGNLTNKSTAKTAEIQAGEEVEVWAKANTYTEGTFSTGINVASMKNPVFYIKEPDGMNIKSGSIVIKQGTKEVDITVAPVEKNGVKYQEVRTKDCVFQGYDLKTCKLRDNMDIGFTYEAGKSMDSSTYDTQDLIFVSPEPTKYTQKSDVRIYEGQHSWAIFSSKDSNDINSNEITDENLAVAGTGTRIIVNKNQVVFIGAQIKLSSEGDDKYRTYKPGDDSTKVYFTPGSTADYLVKIDNRSAYDTERLTVYIPVPKKGQNLQGNFQSASSKWDMALTGPISLENKGANDQTGNFEVLYATNATSSNYSSDSIWKTAAEIGTNWTDVNMVKVHAKNPIEKETATNALLHYKIDVSETEAADLTGEENIFSPSYDIKYDAGTGEYAGESVATVLQTAGISGKVFLDGMGNGQLKNGIKDSNETYYTDVSKPVKVKIISGPAAFVGQEVSVKADGTYKFEGLAKDKYDIQFIIPSDTDYIFTKAHPIGGTSESSNADMNNGKVTGIDSGVPNTATNINAGLTINESPKITVTNAETIQGKSIKLKHDSVSDDMDDAASLTVTSESGVDWNTPGTYAVTYSAVDSHGAKGIQVQKVKVHGTPGLVSSPEMYRTINNPPTMDNLKGNVLLSYLKASDTIGDPAVLTFLSANITAPASVPTTVGKHVISYSSVSAENNVIPAGSVKGTFNLYLFDAPQLSATSGGNDYASGAKTNKSVNIKAASKAGLTLEYRISGGAWKAYPNEGVTVDTTTYINQSYEFRFAEIVNIPGFDATMEKDLVSSYTANINKVEPSLKNSSTNATVANGSTYLNPFNVIAVSSVAGDTVTVVAKKNDQPISYSSGMQVAAGEYEFKITDGYGNTTTVAFKFDAITVKTTDTSITYDAKSHTITAAASETGSILYYSATENGTYTTTPVSYDTHGTHDVWVKAAKANYVTSAAVKAQVKIAKRAISVKPHDESKTFDNQPLVPSTVDVLSNNLPDGDEIDYTNTKFTGSITNPGTTNSAITQLMIKRKSGGADKTDNYTVTTTKGSLEILKAGGLAVTVAGTTVTYDSTAYGLKDVKANIGGTVTNATIYYSTKGATGPWDTTAPTFVEQGTHTVYVYAHKDGYDDSNVKSGIVQIDKRTVAIKPIDVEVEYDGNSHNATKAGVDIKVIPQDGLVVTQALSGGTFVKAETNAGAYKTTASGVKILDSLSNDVTSNYNITYTNGVLKINKSDDMIAQAANKSVVYDSTAQTIDNGSSKWNNADAGATMLYSNAQNGTYSEAKPSYVNVGTYDIWVKASATANHQASAAVKATLDITHKAISVKPQNESKTYDGKVLKADTVELVSGGLGVNDSYDMTNTKFTGAITNPGIEDSYLTLMIMRTADSSDATGNYKVTTTKGSLAIEKAGGLSVIATGPSVTYDGNEHGLTDVKAYIGGKVTDATIYYSTNASGPWSTTAPKFTNQGSHAVYVYAHKNGYEDSNVKPATVTIAKRIITVKPVDVNVEYDGNSHVPTSAILDAKAATANLVSGHTLSGGNFVKAETNAGTYKTTASSVAVVKGGDDLSSNYDIRYTNGELKITRSDDMTAEAANKSVVYNSAEQSIDNGSSKWNNQDAGATMVYSTSQNGTYSEAKPSYVNVGTYDIWVKASATANHQTSAAVKATLDITKKAISVKPQDESRTYNGKVLKADTVELVSGGLGVNDSYDMTNTKFTGSITDPGITESYISPLVIQRTVGGADVTDNYKVTTTKGSLEILKAGGLAVTVAGTTVTYDSTAYGLKDVKANVSGTVTDATIYYSTKGATGPWDTKAPEFTEQGTHTVYVYAHRNGFEDSNVKSGIVQIDKRTVAIKPIDVEVEYDGNAHNATKAGVDITDATKDGLVLTQAIQGGTFVKPETNAGTYKTTVSGVKMVDSLSNDVTSNYDITYTNGVLKINKSDDMTVKATDKALTYDAIAHSIDEGASYWNGSDAGATIVYSTSENGTYLNTRPSYTNAGAYDIWVKAAATANYVTSPAVKATLTINERVITVKPVDVEVEYDGNSHIPTSAILDAKASTANLVSGHTLSDGNFVKAETNAGTYKTTASGVAVVKGGDDLSSNYDIRYTNGELKIRRSDDMSAVANGKTFIYDADAKTIDDGSSLWNGADAGATMLYSDSENGTYSATKPSYTDADSYDIWVKASATANHITSPAIKAVLKIDKREITAKPKDESKTYDGNALTPSEVEVIIGDIPTNDAIDHSATTYTGSITDPGTEASVITSLKINRKSSGSSAVANYDVTLTRGSLEVVSAGGLAITIDSDQVVYDGKTHSVNAAKANINGTDTTATIYYSKTGTAGTWDTSMPTFTDAGTHSVYAYASKTGYHPSNVKNVTMQINERDIELTPVDISKIYDGNALSAVAYTVAGTGLANNESIDTQAVKYTGTATNVADSGQATSVDTSSVKIANGSKDTTANYKITSGNGKLTILKRNITLKPTNKTVTYNGKSHTADSYSIASGSLAAGQSIQASSVDYSGSRTYAGSNSDVKVALSGVRILSGSTNTTANYTLATNTGTVKVTKRTVSVAPVSRSLDVDGNSHGLTDYRITSTTKMASGDRISSVNFTNNSHSAAGDYTVGISKVNVSPSKAEGSYNFNTGTATLTLNATGGGGDDGGDNGGGTTGGNGGDTGTTGTGGTETTSRRINVPEDTTDSVSGTDTVQDTNTVTNISEVDDVASLSIGDTKVPLFGNGSFPSWALFNLVLTIAGILLMAIIFIPILFRKREEDRLEEQGYERRKLFDGKWMIAALLFSVAQILMFAFTQTLSGTMVLFDSWSIVHAVATILTITGLLFSLRVKDESEEADEF